MQRGQPLLSRNAVELVIRHFDQHHQSMCGFDTLQSARTYLRVSAFVYCLTPFADDTPGSIAGRCPLELAGYDLDALPIRTLLVSSSYPHHHFWQKRFSQCRNGHCHVAAKM